MSKRQDRKSERSSKKDKNGLSMALSRPVRRSLQRLQRRVADYHTTGGKNPTSDQKYVEPGTQSHY